MVISKSNEIGKSFSGEAKTNSSGEFTILGFKNTGKAEITVVLDELLLFEGEIDLNFGLNDFTRSFSKKLVNNKNVSYAVN